MNAPLVVVMGVCGCGKSTVAAGLARALGIEFLEGDTLHPAANVARMAAGQPLRDEDRQGWLLAIAQRLAAARAQACGLVVSCSALKRSYRDVLRSAAPGLRFIHLHGERAVLEQRLAARSGHYMPATLLQSQLDALQVPQPDEQAMELNIDQEPAALVRLALSQLQGSKP